jgi:hypothetical protein
MRKTNWVLRFTAGICVGVWATFGYIVIMDIIWM